MFSIRVPASSANIGPGFDCLGLALQLYLDVDLKIDPAAAGFVISISGEGADQLPTNADNLIAKVARVVADGESIALPGLHLHIKNQIPLARGLGSSAAAITAGIAIVEAISERELGQEKFFRYATQFENHADNLSAARYGGFTLACAISEGKYQTLNMPWPADLQALVVIPEVTLETKSARAVLPENYRRSDAVFNLQHALMLQAALAQRRFDLIGMALADRWHQPFRAPLVPGLEAALALKAPELAGVALSGSGPTLLALATGNFDMIGRLLEEIFSARNIKARARLLAIDSQGRSIERR